MTYSVVARSVNFSIAAAMCFVLSGCGGGNTSGGGSAGGGGNGGAVGPAEVKEVDVSKLPSLGDKLPPVSVDGFEVEIGDPTGWTRMARRKDLISAFSKEKNGEMPYIIVKQLPASLVSDFPEVTPENVGDFATALEKKLRSSVKKDLNRELPELPIGLVFGQSAWARYVKGMKSKRDDDCESQVLCTVRGGKMFTIELQVMGSLADANNPKAHRDLAYALAASAVFTKTGDAAAKAESKEESDEAK